MANYKDKITMKFSSNQLERIIIALINNGFNKKFASNVKRLFDLFNPSLYAMEQDKIVRVHLIKEIVNIILKNNIENKDSILAFIDTDGKYSNDLIECLNNLYEEELSDSELNLLDKTIADQLRYSVIMERAEGLSDKLMNLSAENYDSLESMIKELESDFDGINKDIKSARESLENAKKDMSLSSSGFVNVLDNLIQKERNPASKVRTGLQYLNAMFNGGFEKGQIY
jgi:hypothetical protein